MWEKKPVLLMVLATVAILVGTIITMVLPFAWVNTEADRIEGVVPYTPLQQEGRDVYIREGCNNCHSQTVRPLVAEVLRYGDYSKSGEFVYDRPFLWGSKRTGPDIARLGGKYPDAWHYKHMDSPRSMVPETNMPDYPWLGESKIDPAVVQNKIETLGFPYSPEQIKDLNVLQEYTIKNCWPYWDKFTARDLHSEPSFAKDGEHYGVEHHERFARLFLERFGVKLK